MKEEDKWTLIYVLSSWFCNFGHGMIVTVVGPTQPYLAFNVKVDIATINLVWTFGFFGYTLGALLTGLVFRRFCTTNGRKMAFLSINFMITGALMIVLPLVDNFGVLVFARCLQNICLGAYITADTSLVVYTMGPIKSRPFTFALHSLIGVGFLAATFLVTPFLPQDNDQDGQGNSFNQLCTTDNTANITESAIENSSHNEPYWGVRKIAWPFIITGVWCMVCSLGYAILGILPFRMPVYYEDSNDNDLSNSQQPSRVQHWNLLLFLTFFYYVITCGIERIYQPMAYTYGICGLKLSPAEAVVIDQCYNGGFMGGRLSGIFIAKYLKPRTMVTTSLVCCIGAALLLVIVGEYSKIGVYIGTCLLGYFISWQFGGCYSWIAQKGDITGKVAPLFLVGCGTGGAAFPPLSGFVFTSSWGPEGILQLTLIVCILQSVLYATMWKVSRKSRRQREDLELTDTTTGHGKPIQK